MTLAEEIQQAVKTDAAVLGYRESVKSLKSQNSKKVVIAKNVPDNIKKEIEHNAKVTEVPVEVFDGSSKDLGVLCGKPFPISVLVLRS